MALLTEGVVREAARSVRSRFNESASAILSASLESHRTSFDVFLSHSRLDSEIVLGVKAILEAAGQSVYVDWINDTQLDRTAVTPSTANKLRERMRQSQSLFYIHSVHASSSRWTPWELGYFDALNGNVAILPIVQSSSETTFHGQEYLGLYPYVDLTGSTIYIHLNSFTYIKFDAWRRGSDKFRPAA